MNYQEKLEKVSNRIKIEFDDFVKEMLEHDKEDILNSCREIEAKSNIVEDFKAYLDIIGIYDENKEDTINYLHYICFEHKVDLLDLLYDYYGESYYIEGRQEYKELIDNIIEDFKECMEVFRYEN